MHLPGDFNRGPAQPWRAAIHHRKSGPLAILLLFLAGVLASAQEQPTQKKLPDAPSPGAMTQAGQAVGGAFEAGLGMVDLAARTSLIFPALATSTRPLTSAEKFKLFASNSISGASILSSLAGAGIGQATDSPQGYGQEGEGYAKRFGASMARRASSQFFGTWLLASALHEDPRYFVKPTSDIKAAVGYAVRRTFVTRDDRDGHTVANWSGLVGPLAGEALANAYMPPDAQTAGKTFERYGIDIAATAAGNVVKQYWPTIVKRLQPRHQTSATTAPAPTGKH